MDEKKIEEVMHLVNKAIRESALQTARAALGRPDSSFQKVDELRAAIRKKLLGEQHG